MKREGDQKMRDVTSFMTGRLKSYYTYYFL